MAFIGYFIRLLARSLKWMGDFFYRLSNTLNGVLPALLSPSQLIMLLKDNYLAVYPDRLRPTKLEVEAFSLEPWEVAVFNRYRINSGGKILVLGSGWGREAIAIARMGLSVVGVDINYVATRTAHQSAQTAGLSACFHQADLLHLPYTASSFDFVLLSSMMYSAIPGVSRRQTWLMDIGLLLKPGGLVILSFAPDQWPTSMRRVVCTFLNKFLSKLPGANPYYQPGDDCQWGHFLHEFQDEEEIRQELLDAGVIIRELNWKSGFAVVAYPLAPMRP